jgi:hypothetical protein
MEALDNIENLRIEWFPGGSCHSALLKRLERYAAYLDTSPYPEEERAEIARQLDSLIGGHASLDSPGGVSCPSYVRCGPASSISHHDIMADVFERIESGQCKRAIIKHAAPVDREPVCQSVPFPAWYVGWNPDQQVMAYSHTASLALDFGHDVRI